MVTDLKESGCLFDRPPLCPLRFQAAPIERLSEELLSPLHSPGLKMAEDESDDEIELIAAHDNRGQKVELVNLKKSFGHGGASKPTITTGEGGAWGRGAAAKEAPKQKVVTGGGGRGSGKKVVSRGWLGARSAEKAGLARPLKAMNMTPSVQKLGQGGLGGSPQEKKSLPKATGAKADGSRGGPVVGPSASVPEAEETVQERPAAPGGKKKVGRPKKKALVGSSLPTGSVGKKADPLNGVAGASQSVKTAKKAGMPEGVSGMGGTEREPSPKKRKRGRPPKSAAAKRNAAPLEAPPKWVTAGENEDGDTIWKIASPEKNEVTTRLLDSERVEKAATAAASLGRPIGHDGATAGRGAATAGKVEATAGVGAGTAGAGVGTGGLHAGEASGVKLGGKGHAGQAGKRKLDRTTSGESIEDVPLAKIGKMGKGGAKVPQKVLRLEEKILFDRATEKAGPSELSGKEGTDDKGGEIVHEKVAVGAVDKGGVSASAHVPLGQVLAQLTQGRTENGKGGGASLSGGEPLPAQQDPQLFTAPMGFKTLPAKRTFPGGPSQVSVAKKPKLAGGRRARALRANLEAGSGAAGVSGTTKGAPSEGLPRGSQQTEGAGMAARLGGEANVVERKAGLAANKSGSGGQAVKAEERAVTGGERRPGQKVKSASPLKNVAASNRNPPSARDPERMANQAGQSAGAPANGKEERRAKGGGSASTAAREGGRRVEGVQRLGPISTTGELLKTLSASLKVPLTAPVTESQNNPNAPLPERPAQTPSAVPKQPARLKVPKAEAEDLSEIVDVKPIIKGTAARASPDLPASPTGSVSTKPLQGGNSQAKGAPPVLFPAAPQKAPGTSPGGKVSRCGQNGPYILAFIGIALL